MEVEEISLSTLQDVARLFVELWPSCNIKEEYAQCEQILKSPEQTCFLLKEKFNYIGFVYLRLRSEFVEGADEYPIAYVEGIYLQPPYRKLGLGASLIRCSEDWAREKGCRQLASDASISNIESIEFHQKVGFREVARNVCFVKHLSSQNNLNHVH